MKKVFIALLMLFSLDALASPPAAPEDLMSSMKGPVGRYQIVDLPGGDGGRSSVMVLDTANGDLWQWVADPVGKNGAEVKARLIYMGRVIPGGKMGEIIDKGTYPTR